MNRHRPVVRFLTLLWASLQLAAPALSSIADGRLSLDNASKPLTHVEATTSDSCPVVHSPDCGMCRILSLTGSQDAATPSVSWHRDQCVTPAGAVSNAPRSVAIALPHGRAPPTI